MRNMNFTRGQRGQQFESAQVTASRRSVLWRLFCFVMRYYKFSYLVVFVCILITSLTTLASTLFTRTLIDDYIVPLTEADNPSYASLEQVLFKLAIILFFGTLCSYAYNRIMIQVSQGTMLRLRKGIFSHMQTLPISYFDSHSHGDIMSIYTNDVDTLRQVIGQSLPQAFNSLITLTVTFVTMVSLSIPLTLVSVIMAVVMAIATTQLGKRSRRFFKLQQQSLGAVNGFIEEMMQGQKVVKVFCHEEQALAQFEQINENLRSSMYNANRIANVVMPVNGNLGTLAYVLIAVVGAALSLSGNISLTLGTLVSFLTLNKSFSGPISHISQQVNSVLNASVGAERVFNLMDEPQEADNGTVRLVHQDEAVSHWRWHLPDGSEIPVEGDVDFHGVDFGYIKEKQVLFNIEINTDPHQKIAFVGGTGAGKTTITNLINRFYDIQDGKIQYDGINVNDISKSHLRRSLGMVLQETCLFTGTVMENIRYGRLNATDQECIEAAQLVGADDFIRRLSNGYHTVLLSAGANLSQGERQLLAIARTAVANPPVLILDEATSSIDTRTEQMVQRGMDSLMQGRTTFVIAHRLSTVRNADTIVVLDHGRIIEQGSHDELIAMKGAYYRLYTGNMIDGGGDSAESL